MCCIWKRHLVQTIAATVKLPLSGFQNILLPISCITLNSEILWDHYNEALSHYLCCWGIQGQLYLPMFVRNIRRFHIKWRQGMLSLRIGSVNHAGDSLRVVQDTKRVSSVTKVDLWSYSFCHPSVHNLPRFTANPTIPSWLEVRRTHLLLMSHHWSFCLHKTLVNLVDDTRSKVQLRINILNMWKSIWHRFLSVQISGMSKLDVLLNALKYDVWGSVIG